MSVLVFWLVQCVWRLADAVCGVVLTWVFDQPDESETGGLYVSVVVFSCGLVLFELTM